MRLLLDSSTLIFNFEYPHSNSRIIFDLVLAKKLEAFVSEKALVEVSRVLSQRKNAHFVRLALELIRKNCTVVSLDEISSEMEKWKGKIKEKDLEHLASAKHIGAKHIIAYDRDFEPFDEYCTPRQFVDDILGLPPFQTEY